MIDKTADFYLDFNRLGSLKIDARNGDESAAIDVARQFEGLFVQQMLTAMRAAATVDPEQHSAHLDFYHEMYDKQLAQSIAGEGRLGVARMIMKQIDGVGDANPAIAPAEADGGSIAPSPAVITIGGGALAATAGGPKSQSSAIGNKTANGSAPEPQPPADVAPRPKGGDDGVIAASGVRLGRVVDDDFAEVSGVARAAAPWPEPRAFVAGVWPAANRTAERLGVSPRLLVAQAALESGWGRHTMKFDDGRDSFNLFGIKAGPDWQGDVIRRTSLEFEDGALQPRLSQFRAYASPEQSFADYADFIAGRPHYAEALAVAGDDRAYIRAVHAAGYATDPDYADKVIGILDGRLLNRSLAQIDAGELRHV